MTKDRRDPVPPKRAPYEPPQILDTAEFETLALACNKQAPYEAVPCTPVNQSAS